MLRSCWNLTQNNICVLSRAKFERNRRQWVCREVFPYFHFGHIWVFQCFYHQSSSQTCQKVMWRYLPVTGVFIARSIDETLTYKSVGLPLLVIFRRIMRKSLKIQIKFKKRTCIHRKQMLTFEKNVTATGHITAAAKMNPSYSPVGTNLQYKGSRPFSR